MQIIKGKQIGGAYKICLYAPEGIGKSTFASHMPNPIFVDTEGGSGFLDVARTPRPTSWTMLLDQVKYFINHQRELGTLVVDTLDWAERLCIEQVCASKQIKGIEDIPYGKGYVYVAEEFGRFLNLLEELRLRGVHIFLTAHAAIRKFEQPDEMGSYDKWEMKLSKKVAPMVKEFVDALFFANYETFIVKSEDKKNKAQGGQRVMYTSHHSCWDAKNRFGLPDKLPLDFAQLAPLFQPVVQQQEAQLPVIAEQDPDCPFTSPAPEAPDGIPPELWKLMQRSSVGEAEVVEAVAAAGYFPANMRIAQYPSDFIKHLINVWDQVYIFIQKLQSRKENH